MTKHFLAFVFLLNIFLSPASAEVICNTKTQLTNVRKGPSAKTFAVAFEMPNQALVAVVKKVKSPEGEGWVKIIFKSANSEEKQVGFVIATAVAESCPINSNTSISNDVNTTNKTTHSLHSFYIRDGDINKWGYINRSGEWVIQPTFSGVQDLFYEGLAQVGNADSMYGAINQNGEWIIQPKFQSINEFSEGLAFAQTNNKRGFINKVGKWVFQTEFLIVEEKFTEGLISAEVNDKVGYINKSGEWVILPKFDGGKAFSGGLAPVKKDDKWGFINRAGDWVILPKYDWAEAFSEGLAYAGTNKKAGFINKLGEWIIQPKFDGGKAFSGGLAPVENNGKWGFINKSGEWVIQPKWKFASIFSGGLAYVETSNASAYIDNKGQRLQIGELSSVSESQNTQDSKQENRSRYGCEFVCEGQFGTARTKKIRVNTPASQTSDAQNFVKREYKSQCAKISFYPNGGGQAVVGFPNCATWYYEN
jgi:WG containing repeat